MTTHDVLVVGAGVVGLTAAIAIAEAGYPVTIYADQIPGATSSAAGASWGPYLVEPKDKVARWAAHTLQCLLDLAEQSDSGVRMVSGVEASRVASQVPEWAYSLPQMRACPSDELPEGFVTGWRYTVPTVNMPVYLGYLVDRFRQANGDIKQRHLTSLLDVDPRHDVVINCAGMGARELADDPSLYPIRGQVVVVANPGITEFFSEDTGDSPDLLHFLPHEDVVILGGVAVPGDGTDSRREEITRQILDRCASIDPRLRHAKIIDVRVGHRPTRPQIRLETENTDGRLIIHNYGHGGAGVSLSWGCAAEAAHLVKLAS